MLPHAVWDLHQQGLIELLEKVQKICLKSIFEKRANPEYVDLLRRCDLKTPVHCRLISKLILSQEILHRTLTLTKVTIKIRPKIYNLRKFGPLIKTSTRFSVYYFSPTLSHFGTPCQHLAWICDPYFSFKTHGLKKDL